MMIRKNCRLWQVLSLILAMCIPIMVSAQGKQVVNPIVDVEGKPGNKVVGLTPAQVRRAYGFDAILKITQGRGQTIAIVNGFHNPNLDGDVQTFVSKFTNVPPLGDCTENNTTGCLLHRRYSCAGVSCDPCGAVMSGAQKCVPSDPNNPNYQIWALEAAMDVEWAHAIAPAATILLVEVQPNGTTPDGFADPTLDDLLGGVDVALNSGLNVSVVSMSWGAGEFACELDPCQSTPGKTVHGEDFHFEGISKVTFFASAGDAGHGVIYPAASPYVISVGGTRLNVDSNGNYGTEKAWSDTGGGLSQFEPEPHYQIAYPIPHETIPPMRGTPDVAYDAAPGTGFAVYDSVPMSGFAGWSQIGGTSAGPPQWSALFALANSLRSTPLTGADGVLYAVAEGDGDTAFHDVSNGKDGTCGATCKAKPGYDYLTGLGSPKADVLIPALVAH